MDKKGSFIEKKLRGSGGYTIAKISDDEQKMANLGGPELFLAGIGRLETDRFVKYYCNKCEKGYEGAPNIQYENPNEDLGENIILVEKGEYKCKLCDYTIAQYRKFNDAKENKNYSPDSNDMNEKVDNKKEQSKTEQDDQGKKMDETINNYPINDLKSEYNSIEKILGMLTYNNNAQLVGKVTEIGLRKSLRGKAHFSFKITSPEKEIIEIDWDNIDKIGDIIILYEENSDINRRTSKDKNDTNKTIDNNQNLKVCIVCSYKNDLVAVFCEECGKKLIE